MIPSESKPEGSRNKQLLMTHVTPDWYSACDRDIPRFYIYMFSIPELVLVIYSKNKQS